MSASVETMAYARAEGVPWHGLGTAVDGYLTSDDMIRAAGLDWTVAKRQITDDEGYPVAGHYVIRRESDRRHLGVVGKTYEPFTNREAFAFTDGLIQDGIMRYSTAGSLRDGARVWVLGKLDDGWRIGDDDHTSYVLFGTSHDGSYSIHAGAVTVRVVCANTYRQAIRERGVITIRHGRGMRSALADAQRTLQIVTAEQRRMRDFLQSALDTHVERATLEGLTVALFGDPAAAESDAARGKIVDVSNDFLRRFVTPEVMRSGQNAYALFNAATGYADHALRYKGAPAKRAETRFMSTMDGRAASLKSAAQRFLAPVVA